MTAGSSIPATSPGLVALVLCAALLHASWNAVLKGGADRFRSVTVMTAAAGLASVPAILVLPAPASPSWPAIAASMALHLAYNLLLVRAYGYGDFGQVYPVARGSSPLLVGLGAALVAGEVPSAATLAGIVLVSGGILALARGFRRGSGFGTALATGAAIAGYTLADGIGGRLSGHPLSYAAWLFALDGLPLPILLVAWRGRSDPVFTAAGETLRSAAGGIVSLMAYAAVIFAASRAPMGAVSALRETSVVFAALIGRLWFREPLTLRRCASGGAVALGAVLLAARLG